MIEKNKENKKVSGLHRLRLSKIDSDNVLSLSNAKLL